MMFRVSAMVAAPLLAVMPGKAHHFFQDEGGVT
jgi:hypothetical protein